MVEEEITVFEPLAGRRLADEEVDGIIRCFKVTLEIVRNTDWVRKNSRWISPSERDVATIAGIDTIT